jgi:hypothetical protein
MTEEFLQFIWRYGLFKRDNLFTSRHEQVTVIKLGEFNSDSGPDFLNARLKIGTTTWAGNLEVHLKSSDWYKHGHHKDSAFRNVILQVVWEHDREAMTDNGGIVPTVQVNFDGRYYSTYMRLMASPGWIPCFSTITRLNPLLFESWISSLAVERLQQRKETVMAVLKQNCNNWDEAFYIFLARSFGAGVNSLPFEMLARSLPLSILERHKGNIFQVTALLTGQAGFPGTRYDNAGEGELIAEYEYLQIKYSLKPIEKHIWKFMRTRPANFPDVRIEQFASLINIRPRLFQAVIECRNRDDIFSLFNIIRGNESSKPGMMKGGKAHNQAVRVGVSLPGKSFIDSLIINCAVPFLYIYAQETGKSDLSQTAIDILNTMAPENNRITKNWEKLGVTAENAFHSQGLIQITSEYCMKKRCLACSTGNRLITM